MSGCLVQEQQTKIFFGWWVLIAIGYSLFVGAGMIFYAMSVLLEAIVATTDFSVAQISGANTVFLVAGGLAGIAVGELISRYDARYCVAVGTLFVAVIYYALPAAQSLAAIYLAYAALGVGYAMTALVPATTLVARWFVRRRALAIALTQSGLSLGGLSLRRYWPARSTSTGWRACARHGRWRLSCSISRWRSSCCAPRPRRWG